jgi:hypothetical protein
MKHPYIELQILQLKIFFVAIEMHIVLWITAIIIVSCCDAVGVWKRISGKLELIPDDDGTDTRIPQYWSPVFAAYQGTGYLYGGSRTPAVWDTVSDYVYKVDLETASVLKISGSGYFGRIPNSLPTKGVAGSAIPPPKDNAAL